MVTCDRQNYGSFKAAHILISGTCEYVTLQGKREFADVIKDLKMEKLFWNI